MSAELKKQLAHIFWIGGATDSGKSTVAQRLAERWGASVYHFDRDDATQMQTLSSTLPEVDKFLKATMEQRWIQPDPGRMLDFLLLTFPHRFQLVLEHLLALPNDQPILVEGFGLLPELIHPLLSSLHQAVWFVPTEKFKRESMIRRGKPSFAATLSDPEKARMNLFTRDMMLADYYRRLVSAYGYTLFEVDGSQSPDEITNQTEAHFSKYLAARQGPGIKKLQI
jgi:2-phosphoglycerate kinase